MTAVVLAFDCSGAACSAAVATGGAHGCRLLAHRAVAMQRGHAAAIAPMISAALEDAGLRASAIDLVAVTIGPGSFTGVRIGLATARGLALALGVPLAGVTTIETLLAGVTSADRQLAAAYSRRLLAAIDTHRGDYYVGFDDEPVPFVADTDRIAARVGRTVTVIGDGAASLCAALSQAGIDSTAAPPTTPDADVVARLALRRGADSWRTANHRDGMPRPLYLRAAEVSVPRRA